MATYTTGYNFNPGDKVWILDGQSIKEGTCLQTDITLVNDSANNLVETIEYLVLLNCNQGTMLVLDDQAYPSLINAVTALEAYMATLTC